MYTFHVTDVCLWCHCTCMFAFYCSSHLAGSVSLADSVKSMHQLISQPTDRSSEGNSSGLKTDIGPISVLCRFNMISMSGRYSNRHRTYTKTYCKIWAARYRLIISPHNTYEEALREHKLVTLQQRRNELCNRLFKDIQNSSHRLNSLLPRQRNPGYQLRHSKKYPLPLLKTNRFKSSLINWCLYNCQ